MTDLLSPTPPDPNAVQRRSLTVVGIILFFGMMAVTLGAGALMAQLGWSKNVITGVLLVVLVVSLVGGAGALGTRRERTVLAVIASASAMRQSAQELARAAGWQWSTAAPAPAMEIGEAVFREDGRFRAWPIGMSEVVTGTTRNGRQFFAGHLVGYSIDVGGKSSIVNRRDENLVAVTLPDLLPEIRLVDLEASNGPGFGVVLPTLPPPAWMPARWQVQGFVPEFAAELLTPRFIDVLATAPANCTVVIRHGSVVCCRDLRADFESIRDRVAFLDRLVDAVPAGSWHRTSPVAAGAGIFRTTASLGDLNRPRRFHSQAERLDHLDWLGGELALIPWQQAPDLPLTTRVPSAHRLLHLTR